ncbi:hypothetical protein [Planotetraspora kaengkrachanensis]|uniref:Uncharacterized protein n=1 Tax=Planotetraspora kaengkrachanensis TaxID=575193 RepID=A0A8J3PZR3_9ACTN|nr:hypothetical protein [Planotetraspora kaengkrachanensis]GIG83992.1 hypothetical protein Pka01_71190 [Planotetraspora kaengkrachanensis]
MPTPDFRGDGLDGLFQTDLRARLALDAVRRRGPEAVEEETLRMKSELVRLYGWEGYQRVISKMESDLARLHERPAP